MQEIEIMSKRKIRTSLLSYGMSGEVFHGPLLEAHAGFEVVSVMQRNAAKAPRHGYRVVNDYQDILNDESVELVVVNTPNESHHRYALQALQASKNVIVEKPFTVTVEIEMMRDGLVNRGPVLTRALGFGDGGSW